MDHHANCRFLQIINQSQTNSAGNGSAIWRMFIYPEKELWVKGDVFLISQMYLIFLKITFWGGSCWRIYKQIMYIIICAFGKDAEGGVLEPFLP